MGDSRLREMAIGHKRCNGILRPMTGRGPDRAALNTYRIETERLVLEVPSESDAPALFSLVGGDDRQEVTAGLLWDGPDEISETLGFIRQAQTERYGESGFHWAIRDRTGDDHRRLRKRRRHDQLQTEQRGRARGRRILAG